jgi:hypothetical protein
MYLRKMLPKLLKESKAPAPWTRSSLLAPEWNVKKKRGFPIHSSPWLSKTVTETREELKQQRRRKK